MGLIKKIRDSELLGGVTNNDIYPVTSIRAVYNDNNESLYKLFNDWDLKHIGNLWDDVGTLSDIVYDRLVPLEDSISNINTSVTNLTSRIDNLEENVSSGSDSGSSGGSSTPPTPPEPTPSKIFYLNNIEILEKGAVINGTPSYINYKIEKFNYNNITEDFFVKVANGDYTHIGVKEGDNVIFNIPIVRFYYTKPIQSIPAQSSVVAGFSYYMNGSDRYYWLGIRDTKNSTNDLIIEVETNIPDYIEH